jgi:hypothetical protein
MPIDYTTAVGQVRLLANDVDEDPGGQVFTDDQINSFLALEAGNVKRAAAQAVDTIADNEALCSKVITDHQLTTDGAKLADSLRKRATTLRAQADVEDDGGYFDVVSVIENPDAPGAIWDTAWQSGWPW